GEHGQGDEGVGRRPVEDAAKALFGYPSDFKRIPVDRELPPNHVKVARKTPLPVGVGENGDGRPARPRVIGRRDHAARGSADAERLEVVAAYIMDMSHFDGGFAFGPDSGSQVVTAGK